MAVDGVNLRRILERLAPKTQEFLVEMIRHPSTHGNEGSVQECAARTWEAAGFAVDRHPIPESIRDDPEYTKPEKDASFEGRENLVVRVSGKKSGRSVIFNAHTDVIPSGDWREAYEPRVEGDAVYGRGACDDKGGVAALYLAALAMREVGLPSRGEIIHQIVIDEEVGGNGSLALIREGIRADGVVVLEATELAMHPANRGALWFRFDFEGKSCHMGRKYDGINAIDLACEAKAILYEYEKELDRDQERQPLFAGYKHPAQVNIGMLRGGDFPSQVAGWAVMEGGVGFLPNRPMEQVKMDLARYLEERASKELRARHRLTFPKLHNDSFETPVEHPLVQAFHAATLETQARKDITGWPVSCDARLFAKVGGMATVVFGPGSIQDAHSAREGVRMSEIVVAAETLVRFVERWC
ncbi:MAG: M20/M25/M40 family metallo-hydrolase [Planctomycetota bacterium]